MLLSPWLQWSATTGTEEPHASSTSRRSRRQALHGRIRGRQPGARMPRLRTAQTLREKTSRLHLPSSTCPHHVTQLTSPLPLNPRAFPSPQTLLPSSPTLSASAHGAALLPLLTLLLTSTPRRPCTPPQALRISPPALRRAATPPPPRTTRLALRAAAQLQQQDEEERKRKRGGW
eukprot:3902259-Rhodomonas_salina.6